MPWLRRYDGDLRDCIMVLACGLAGGLALIFLYEAATENEALTWLAERLLL